MRDLPKRADGVVREAVVVNVDILVVPVADGVFEAGAVVNVRELLRRCMAVRTEFIISVNVISRRGRFTWRIGGWLFTTLLAFCTRARCAMYCCLRSLLFGKRILLLSKLMRARLLEMEEGTCRRRRALRTAVFLIELMLEILLRNATGTRKFHVFQMLAEF